MMTLAAGKPFFFKLPFIPVEIKGAIDSVSCYQKHTHDEFSIGIVEKGMSRYFYSGKQDTLGPGSVALINPGDVHACNPTGDASWSYRMLYADTAWLQALQGSILRKPVDQFIPFRRHHISCEQTFTHMSQLFALLGSDSECLQKEEAIIRFFSTLISRENRQSETREKENHRALLIAKEYIADNCEKDIRIDKIAAISGLSHYYLIHAFRKQFGITPHAYQLTQRINRSKDLLRRGATISTVAVKTGFTDQSHFHRHFKRIVAVTPKQYRDSFL